MVGSPFLTNIAYSQLRFVIHKSVELSAWCCDGVIVIVIVVIVVAIVAVVIVVVVTAATS